jgi:hypothetical protein
MTLAACWILLPLALGTISLGCGVLLDRAAGRRIPGPLLMPAGLALVMVVAGFTTATDSTAELTVPLACVLGAAGLFLSGRQRPRGVDGWAIGVAVGVYLAFALPVVASGEATFAGYVKLDDTATWLAISDHLLDHGHDVSGLAPSTYEATLTSYLGSGYPTASFVPLALARSLLDQDAAWLFQPLVGFYASMLALTLYGVAAGVAGAPRTRVIVVFVASQGALLFAYSLWGGLKELALAWLLALVAALLGRTAREPAAGAAPNRLALVRSMLPAAMAIAALLGVASAAAAAWVAAPVLLAIVAWRGAGLRRVLARTGVLLALAAALSAPVLLEADVFLSEGGRQTLTGSSELGNLAGPLEPLQVLGIWPAGDFRFDPDSTLATNLLLAALVVAALAGVVIAVRRRAWAVLMLAAGAALGCSAIVAFGSPWVDAKAMAIASPVPVFVAMLGACLAPGRLRVWGGLLAVAIAVGVVWSNALAYREVNLAPRERLVELERIGERVEGEGPLLMTEYEPYGVRHFLRAADPEGASEFSRRRPPLRSGRPLRKLEFADLDEFSLDAILTYRTLVLRRSPVASRPPSPYLLVSRGRYYDVWQRPAGPPPDTIVEHMPLGDDEHPAGVARCAGVRRLARLAERGGANGHLLAATTPPMSVRDLGRTDHPAPWLEYPNDERTLFPGAAGRLETEISVPRSGRYRAWLGGAFRRRVELAIDGRRVADERHNLSHANQFEPMGTTTLVAGPHKVELRYDEPDLMPGSDGTAFPFGPLALGASTATTTPVPVRVRDASVLCGRPLDWIEAVRD